MSLFGQLTDKSWLAASGTVDYFRDVTPARARRGALKVFLMVVAVVFLLLVAAYAERMAYEDWRPAPQQKLLWANTAILVLVSMAFHWAQFSVRRMRLDAARAGLLAGGALTLVFLGGQILAWRQLGEMPFFTLANPAIAFFYLITAMHGLHLLGGLVAWGRLLAHRWSDADLARIRHGIELCTLYWHFLLGVWVVLFGLLFSGDNLDLLLKLCGIR